MGKDNPNLNRIIKRSIKKERIVNTGIMMGVFITGCLVTNVFFGLDTYHKLHSEESNHGKLAAVELAEDISKNVDKRLSYYFELGSKLVADNYVKDYQKE